MSLTTEEVAEKAEAKEKVNNAIQYRSSLPPVADLPPGVKFVRDLSKEEQKERDRRQRAINKANNAIKEAKKDLARILSKHSMRKKSREMSARQSQNGNMSGPSPRRPIMSSPHHGVTTPIRPRPSNGSNPGYMSTPVMPTPPRQSAGYNVVMPTPPRPSTPSLPITAMTPEEKKNYGDFVLNLSNQTQAHNNQLATQLFLGGARENATVASERLNDVNRVYGVPLKSADEIRHELAANRQGFDPSLMEVSVHVEQENNVNVGNSHDPSLASYPVQAEVDDKKPAPWSVRSVAGSAGGMVYGAVGGVVGGVAGVAKSFVSSSTTSKRPSPPSSSSPRSKRAKKPSPVKKVSPVFKKGDTVWYPKKDRAVTVVKIDLTVENGQTVFDYQIKDDDGNDFNTIEENLEHMHQDL